MKVLLVNGSPNAEGCTYTALQAIATTLVTVLEKVWKLGTSTFCTSHKGST